MAPADDRRSDGRSRLGRAFWEIIRTAGSVELRVVRKDAELAREIADSVTRATCRAVMTPPLRFDTGSGSLHALCAP